VPLTHARARRRGRLAQVTVLGLAGIILSVAAFQIARRTDLERVKGILELRVEWRASDIERKLAVAGRSAEALAIYLAAEGEVTAARFHNFARLAHDQTDFDSALYWSPWVDGADRASFVAAARREVDPEYDIRDIAPDGRFVSADPRARYLPQLYEETFDHSPGIGGFDMLARTERRMQVERARDGGEPLASPPFSLLMGGARVPGFLILWPVYTTGTVPPPIARRAAFRGIATVRFRLDRVLPALIADTPDIIEAIDIAAGADPVTAHLIASFDPALMRFTIGDTPAPVPEGSLTLQRDFTVLGQYWTLRSHFAPETMSVLTSTAPWAWLFCGLLTTAILLVYVWRQTAQLGEAEVKAIETDDRFRRLFDENPIGMVLATADEYRFVRVNAAFCKMLEYSSEELVGHVRNEFSAPDSIDMPLPAGGSTDPGWNDQDKHYVCKSGKIITTRVRVMRLAPTATGEAFVLGLAEDVTEQRKLEETLRQAQKREEIGQLTGGMAHDFNNLLGVIIGNLDLLQPLLQNQEEAEELVDEAVTAALRGADLTQRLLAFARRQPLNPNRIALNEQVTEITKLLTRTLGERVRIALHLAPDAWPVLADPTQLEACVINLATNARDAMPNGGTLTIATANRTLDADYAASHADVKAGDYAMIEISDNGTGMPPDVLARVFEPFFTTKEAGKGTGLGLSMVFGFLKQSNGHINAYSEPGVGTTFRVYLPRTDEDANELRSAVKPAMRRGNGEIVLVVEDNESLRRVAARQLKDLGYAVIEADDAAAAVEVLADQPVALVFTDIVMPGDLDGFGLARDILARWPSTKVLLTSGFPETKINGKLGALAGSARLLGKPYRTDDLARVVREVLEA
jgi:PAS domain S-box-containing protein